MNPAFPDALLQKIRQLKIIAVVVIDNAEDAVPLANALVVVAVQQLKTALRFHRF